MMNTKKALVILGVIVAVAILAFTFGKTTGLGATLLELKYEPGKIFLMGGAKGRVAVDSNGNSYYMNDVWVTNDMVRWTQISPDAPSSQKWAQRILYGYGSSVYFNNKIWVIGGNSSLPNEFKNDIWSSADGINWTQVTANAPWTGRIVAPVVFNNKLWVIGGAGNGVMYGDVWSSPDGTNWTRVPTNVFLARALSNPIVFNNKLWVMGGWDSQHNDTNDVWSSPDGIDWTQVTANAPWGARTGHVSLVFNNMMWVLGGRGGHVDGYNDVWSSPDGINWTQKIQHAGWIPRIGHTALVFNNKMYITGGSPTDPYMGNELNDVWSSPDGINWTQVTANAPWIARYLHQTVVVPPKSITPNPKTLVPVVPINPTLPITKDFCPNISGIQTSVPTGYVVDRSGNCVKQVNITPTTLQNATLLTATNTIETCTATTTPWIKVISPNGGEVYRTTDSVRLLWKTCNLSNNKYASIIDMANPAIEYPLGYGDNFGSTINHSGLITNAPSVGRKNFKVKVYETVGNNTISDLSDDTFTINP